MSRRVIISGLGPVSGLGIGLEPNWQATLEGRSAIGPVQMFDASGFDCKIACEVQNFKVSAFVPKTYRKATKVMARDIGLAVASADLAARDASLTTKGTADNKEDPHSYKPDRMGAHIGAGLIAVDLDELTEALAEAQDDKGQFDYHQWGSEGINHLTPLWLLKYLPNMLACHVTIIHDAQGPSNTITCTEASSLLSIGESLRVIQRGSADLCFCGGAESKLNPLAYFRQLLSGRVNLAANDQPETAVRPFSKTSGGTVVGEGSGIVTIEALETYQQRISNNGSSDHQCYAEIVGFGASQSPMLIGPELTPEIQQSGLHLAINHALREARIRPDDIDMIVPFGIGLDKWDHAEVTSLQKVFGDRLNAIPMVAIKPLVGNCGAGAGGLDVCMAAKALAEQTIPPRINCDDPIEGIGPGIGTATKADLNYVLVCSMGFGGQNSALILKRIDE